MKERGSSDIADALLSLKHAVVRPSMNGQMSPLSPGFSHLAQSLSPHGPCPGGGLAPPMGGHGQGLVTYGHSLQYNPQCGMDNITTNTTGTQTQTNLFPAMSVNVSMSMNVGMPQANFQDPWGAPAPQGYAPTQCPRPPSPNIHVQTNYPAYSPPNQGYCGGYGIPDTREVDHGDMYYRTACEEPQYQSVSRLYSFHAQLRRSKPPTPTGMMAPDHAKINLCRICGKTYARPSTLKTHLRTHSGEKPYKCSTCGKSFSQAANLTAHLRTHSGEKPFRCPVCDRRFSQSSSVTTHMRTHSGERPYRCRLCKKAFSDSSTLTKHLRIHSGEKPYQCKLCLLRFSQSGNLNRHMRIHNNSNA